MNERKTSSILQRVPVILAVTAASYGLQFPPVQGAGRAPAKQGVKAAKAAPPGPANAAAAAKA